MIYVARIAEEDINNIRSNADIVSIIGSYIKLEAKGKNYFGICPFHNDHNPSMSVSPDKQIYTCFVCGASGNVFSFVQNYENVSFIEAVKIIADKIGYNINININENRVNQKYYDMTSLASKYFVNNLNGISGEAARKYLINERRLDEKTIEEFNIGFASNDNNLSKLLKSKGYSDKEIIDVSLASFGSTGLLDLFRGRITFPINNDKGEPVAFSARIFNGESDSKYINSRENVIFKKGNILFNYDKCKTEASKEKKVILVEGQMDAIRVYSSGIKYVCASLGTALTDEHIKLLKRLNAKVILCMDNDKAGEKSTLANGEALIKNNLEVMVVRLSGEKDPDSYILKYGVDAYRDAINNAVTYFDFKMSMLKSQSNLNKADELANYINSVIDELNKSDDDILKSVTISKLASEYNLDKKLLESKLIKKEPVKIIPVKINKRKLSRNEKSAEALINIMMSDPKYIKLYEKRLGYIPDKTYRLIANDILAYYKLHNAFNVADFISYTESYPYSDLILKILSIEDYSPDDFEMLIKYIKNWDNEEKIKELKEEIKKITDINEKEKINDLIIKIKRGSEEYEEN